MAVPPAESAHLHRARLLQYATIAWNLVEVFVTIGLGVAANSLALIAFGLDSIVEVAASLVLVWYIADHTAPGRARRSLQLVAVVFGLLTVYLLVAAGVGLVGGDAADASPLGIAYLAVTSVVMFTLARVKRATARAARSAPLAAEAAVTFLDGCLAAGVLAALVLNAVAGLWWADAAAAVLVAGFAGNEARSTWQEASELGPSSSTYGTPQSG